MFRNILQLYILVPVGILFQQLLYWPPLCYLSGSVGGVSLALYLQASPGAHTEGTFRTFKLPVHPVRLILKARRSRRCSGLFLSWLGLFL